MLSNNNYERTIKPIKYEYGEYKENIKKREKGRHKRKPSKLREEVQSMRHSKDVN